MSAVGYACALLLAAVFVRAAVVKLARPDTTADAFGGLGLPAAAFLARVVPVAELVLATVLVASPPAGGAAALVLLALFSAVLFRALRAGTTTGCGCFGGTGTEPVSGVDLGRNAVLAVLAVLAVVAPGTGASATLVLAVVLGATGTSLALVALARARGASRGTARQ